MLLLLGRLVDIKYYIADDEIAGMKKAKCRCCLILGEWDKLQKDVPMGFCDDLRWAMFKRKTERIRNEIKGRHKVVDPTMMPVFRCK